jgi:hypothetical protein
MRKPPPTPKLKPNQDEWEKNLRKQLIVKGIITEVFEIKVSKDAPAIYREKGVFTRIN